MNLKEIYEIARDNKNFIILLQELNLLKKVVRCKKCRRKMTVQKQSEVVLGHVYICNACSTLRTILSNSILEDMKTSPLSLFVLLYCFYYQLDNTTFLKTETGIETNDSLCFY